MRLPAHSKWRRLSVPTSITLIALLSTSLHSTVLDDYENRLQQIRRRSEAKAYARWIEKRADVVDDMERHLEEFGIIGISSPILTVDDKRFTFQVTKTGDEFYEDAIKDRQGNVAVLNQVFSSLGVGVSLEADVLQMIQAAGALKVLSKSLEAAQKEKDPAKANQIANEGLSSFQKNMATIGGGDAPTTGTTPALKAEDIGIATLQSQAAAARGALASFANVQSLLGEETGPTLSQQDALVIASNSFGTKGLLEYISDPDLRDKFKDKWVVYGAATVGVNPGWRTREGYAGRINITAKYAFTPADQLTGEKLIQQIEAGGTKAKIPRGVVDALKKKYCTEQPHLAELEKLQKALESIAKSISDSNRTRQAADTLGEVLTALKAKNTKKGSSNGDGNSIPADPLAEAVSKLAALYPPKQVENSSSTQTFAVEIQGFATSAANRDSITSDTLISQLEQLKAKAEAAAKDSEEKVKTELETGITTLANLARATPADKELYRDLETKLTKLRDHKLYAPPPNPATSSQATLKNLQDDAQKLAKELTEDLKRISVKAQIQYKLPLDIAYSEPGTGAVPVAPLIAPIAPLSEAQVLDLESSRRRQREFVTRLSIVMTALDAKAGSNLFSSYVKRLESDLETRNAANTMNVVSYGGGNLTVEVGPELRAISNPTDVQGRPGNTLDRQTFPILLAFAMSQGDVEPKIKVNTDGTAEFMIPGIEIQQTYTWVPLSRHKARREFDELARFSASLRTLDDEMPVRRQVPADEIRAAVDTFAGSMTLGLLGARYDDSKVVRHNRRVGQARTEALTAGSPYEFTTETARIESVRGLQTGYSLDGTLAMVTDAEFLARYRVFGTTSGQSIPEYIWNYRNWPNGITAFTVKAFPSEVPSGKSAIVLSGEGFSRNRIVDPKEIRFVDSDVAEVEFRKPNLPTDLGNPRWEGDGLIVEVNAKKAGAKAVLLVSGATPPHVEIKVAELRVADVAPKTFAIPTGKTAKITFVLSGVTTVTGVKAVSDEVTTTPTLAGVGSTISAEIALKGDATVVTPFVFQTAGGEITSAPVTISRKAPEDPGPQFSKSAPPEIKLRADANGAVIPEKIVVSLTGNQLDKLAKKEFVAVGLPAQEINVTLLTATRVELEVLFSGGEKSVSIRARIKGTDKIIQSEEIKVSVAVPNPTKD